MGLTAGIVLGNGGDGGKTNATYGDTASLVSALRQGDAVGVEREWRWTQLVLYRVQAEGASLDVPPTPPQGRTPTAAAGELSYRQADVGRVVGELVEGELALGGAVSYTPLGEIVAGYDWMPEAFRIVDCESSWDAGAVSWDGSSWGLWQIHAVHFWRWPNAWNEWMIPEVNTRWAWELYQEFGWGIWSCY